MSDVTALVSQMSETLAQIHETIAGLDTAAHDSKLDALEQECESAIQALQESFELESADLDRKRKSTREEIAEQRRKEDEEREARRRREDEELVQNEQTEDEQRQVKLHEQTEGIEEQTDAKMDEAEEEARRRLEEGERRLVDLEERRKEINRLIEEQMRAPLPPLPARRRARTSVSRGAVGAASRSAPSEAKSKPEAPAAEEQPAPAVEAKSIPALADKSVPVADEKLMAAADEKPTAVADEKPAAAPADKSIPATEEKPVVDADETTTPAPVDKSIPVVDEKPTPAAEEKLSPVADEMPTPVTGEKPEEKIALIENQLVPAPIVAAEEKSAPVLDEKQETAGDKDIKALDTDATEETPIDVPISAAKADERSVSPGVLEPVPENKGAADKSDAPEEAHVVEAPKEEDRAAKSETKPVDEHISEGGVDSAPGAIPAVEMSEVVSDEAPQATEVIAKQDAETSQLAVERQGGRELAIAGVRKDDNDSEEPDAAPLATGAAVLEAPAVQPREVSSDMTAKATTEAEILEEAPAPNSPLGSLDLKVKSLGSDGPPADSQVEIPARKGADETTEQASVAQTSKPLGSPNVKIETPATAAAYDASAHAEGAEMPPVQEPEQDVPSEIKAVSEPMAEPVAASKEIDSKETDSKETDSKGTDSKAVAPTPPSPHEATQPGSRELEDGHLEHQIESQQEVTQAEGPLAPQESAVGAQEAEPKTEARTTDILSAHALDREESVSPDGTQGLDSDHESNSEYEKLDATPHDAAGPVAETALGIVEDEQLDQPAPAERLASDALPHQPEHSDVSELKLSATEAAVDIESHDEDSTEPELLSDNGGFDLHHPGFSSKPLADDLYNPAEGPDRSQIASQITGADKTPSTEPADREAAAVIHQAEELEGDELSKPAVEAVTDSRSETAATHEKPTELFDHTDTEEVAKPEELKEAPEKESNVQVEHTPVLDAALDSGSLGQDDEAAVHQEISHGRNAKPDHDIREAEVDVVHATKAPKAEHEDDHDIQAGDEASVSLGTTPITLTSAPSTDLDVKPSAVPNVAEAGDIVETEAPVKAKEPNKTQEAIEVKDTIKSEGIAKAEEPVKAEHAVQAEDSVKAEEPIKVEDSIKAVEATETDAAAKIGETLEVKVAEPQDAAAAIVQAPTQDEAAKVQDAPKEPEDQLPLPDNKTDMDIAESQQVADVLTQDQLAHHEPDAVIADNDHPVTPLEAAESATKAHSLQTDDGLGNVRHGPADLTVSDMPESQLEQMQDAGSQVLVAGEPAEPAAVDYDDSQSGVSSAGSAFELDHRLPTVPLASHTGEPVSPLDASDLSSLAHNNDLPPSDLAASDTEDEAPQRAQSLDATLDLHSISREIKLGTAEPRLGAASEVIPAIKAPVGQQEAAKGQTPHSVPASFDQYESAHETRQHHDDSGRDSDDDRHGAVSLAPLNKSPAAEVDQESVAVPHLGPEADTAMLSGATSPQLYAAPLQQAGDLQTYAQYPQASTMEESTATVYGTDDLFENDSEVSDQSSHGAKAQDLGHQAVIASSGQEYVGHHDTSAALESGDAHEPASPAGVHVQMAPEAKPKDTEEVAPADSRPDLTVMTEQRPVSQELLRNIEEDLRTPRALPDATSEQLGAAPTSTPHLAPAAAIGHNEDISPLLLRNQSPIAPFKGLEASRHAPRPDSLQFTPMKFPAEVVTEHESSPWEESQEHSDLEADGHYGQQSQGWGQNSLEQYPPTTPRAQMPEPHSAQQDSPDAARGRSVSGSLASELEQASDGMSYGHEGGEMDPDTFMPRDVTNVSWHARTDSVPASLHSRTTLSSAPSSPIHAALQQDNHEPVIRDSWATVPQNQHEFLAGLGGDYSNRPRGYTQSTDYGRARGVSEVSQYDPFRYDAGGPGGPKSGGMVQNIGSNDLNIWQPQEPAPAPQQTRESPPPTLASKRESMAPTPSPGSLFQRMRNVFEKPQDGSNAETDAKGMGSPARSRPVSGVFYPVKPATPRSNRNSMVYDGTAQASTQGALGGLKYDSQTPGGAQKGWRQEDYDEQEGVDENSSLLSGTGMGRAGAR
ncbi:hypothetical protein RB595_006298 [Gaeumannomyces hyphopodioides]